MMELPLSQVTDELPRCTIHAEAVEPDDSYHIGAAEPAGYVWPNIFRDNNESPSSVVLVTAAGAMGKSMAAAAMASRMGCPLIDLSKLRVGSDSLTGLLTRVLGWERAPSLIRSLFDGTASVILDGLDEAQLAAGRDHYVAFLRNVGNFVKGGSQKGQIVMFGRRDVVETTYLELEELGVSVKIAHIAPLNYEQTVNLIDNTLDKKTRNGGSFEIHRIHNKPFAELRDHVLANMAQALGATGHPIQQSWPFVRDFLGYPPVGLVLAERLAVDNPSAEMHRSHTSNANLAGRAQRGLLLKAIVEGILDRESSKVRAQMHDSFPAEGDKVDLLYGRDEQLLRVLDYVGGLGVEIIPPAMLTASERARYDEHIRTFLPDHPFVVNKMFANTVFSDYLRAYFVSAPLAALHGISDTVLVNACPPAGPFFTYFAHALSAKEVAGSSGLAVIGEIAEVYVDDLVRSHVAGTEHYHFAISISGEKGVVVLSESSEDGSAEAAPLIFRITDISGVLELNTPLSRCVIATSDGVVLKSRFGEIELGPDVFLMAESIELIGKKVVAVAGDRGVNTSVLLVAESATHDSQLEVRAYPQGSLGVHWDQPWPQWRPFYKDEPAGLHDDPIKALQVVVGVRRILRSFHQGGGSRPTIFGEMLDNLVVGENQIFSAVLRVLQKIGIIVLEGGSYHLVLDRLADFKVSWASINRPDFESALEPLMVEVRKDDEIKAIITREAD
jgi:hypothetical protein